MKTIDGYSKEKFTNDYLLKAGGDAIALSSFIGALSWDSTNKKITYTPVGGSATDLVSLSWDNIAGKPSLAAESHEHGAGDITSGTLAIARGGTNKSTWTKYGIVYASDANVLGQISVPTWAASKTYWLKAVTNASKVPTYSLAILSKSDVGLGNVDNTADANKSVLYAATSGDSDTVDAHHVTTAGSLPYKFSHSVTLASGSITGDYWYVTLSFTGRSYIWELTKSIITSNYSNKQGQFYLNTYEYTGTWFGFSTAYNGSNLVSIAHKSQNKPIYYLKLRKPVTYSGSVPDGVVEVKSTYDFTLTASANAPSEVTFIDIAVPGFTNLSVPWGSLTGLPESFTPTTHEHSTADITSGTLGVARGGTGKASWTKYGIVYASDTTTLSQISLPTWAASTTYWLKCVTNASSVPTYSLSTISKSDVGLSNVENTKLSTWAGSSNITTLGTVTTGTWNATAITAKYGGTGLSGDNAFTGAYRIVYTSSATALTTLGPNTSTTKKFLRMTGTGSAGTAPTWDTVTKSDVGLGNVENTALSTWAGSTNITTLGTIATGTWSASTIAVNKGGTGKTSWTKYGIVYASDTTTLAQISLPTWAASTTYFLKAVTNSSKVPTYSLTTIGKSDVGLGNVDNTADANKSVNYATSAGSVAWANITGKPDSFTPDAHNHWQINSVAFTVPATNAWYRIASIKTTGQIRGSVLFYIFNNGGNGNEFWTKFSFDSDWSRANANWIHIDGVITYVDGLSLSHDSEYIYINIHFKNTGLKAYTLFVPDNSAGGVNKNSVFTWLSGELPATTGTVVSTYTATANGFNASDGITANAFYGNASTATGLSAVIADAKLPARLREGTSATNASANNFKTSGFYYSNTAASLPANQSDCNILTIMHSTSWGHQLAFKFNGVGTTGDAYDGKEFWIRHWYSNSSWYPWYVVCTAANTGWVYDSNFRYEPHTKRVVCLTANNSWNKHFYSTKSYVSDCAVSFKPANKTGIYMIGLNTDPTTDKSYTSIDYCFYLHSNGTVYIYESSSNVTNWSGYNAGDEFRIEYAGGYIRYFQNGTLKRSVARSGSGAFYVDSSFYTTSEIYDLEFTSGSIYASNADTVDSYHVSSYYDTLYKSSYSLECATSSMTNYWYITIKLTGTWQSCPVTRILVYANYSNCMSRAEITAYGYGYGYDYRASKYNSDVICGIASGYSSGQYIYLRMMKPITYNNALPNGTATVYGSNISSVTASATAPSGVTFTDTLGSEAQHIHSGQIKAAKFIGPLQGNADTATSADSATTAGSAGYATSAGSASYADSAGSASSATDADKVDGYHASDLVKFYLSPMTSNAPASSAKSWFTDTMPSSSGAIVYNVPGSEKTIIAGKSSGSYGHMLQLSYDDNYLRLLRYQGGSWKTTDWEKISAGAADTVKTAAYSPSSNVVLYPTFVDSSNSTAAFESVYTYGSLAYYPYVDNFKVNNIRGTWVGDFGKVLAYYTKSITGTVSTSANISRLSCADGFSGYIQKTGTGTYKVSLTNTSTNKQSYNYQNVQCVITPVYTEASYEMAMINFATYSTSVSKGNSCTWTFYTKRLHCQGSWSTSDFVQSIDNIGFTLIIFGYGTVWGVKRDDG